LLEQIAGAQAALESNIEELRRAVVAGGHGAPGQAEAQLQGLSKLQHRVVHAQGGSLASIRAEVIASIAATQAFVQQARTASSTAEAVEVALHAASAAAHREVTDLAHDFYDKKIFDPYLRFTSDEDEKAYREREGERQRYIADELTKGTPEGNLNATQAMMDQMKDAKAHGADASPEFERRNAALESADAQLRGALQTRDGVVEKQRADTAEPKKATATIDPLDAIAPTLDEGSKQAIERMRAAGIVVAEVSQAEHGVTSQTRPGQSTSRVV
jgi:hypothetical protein